MQKTPTKIGISRKPLVPHEFLREVIHRFSLLALPLRDTRDLTVVYNNHIGGFSEVREMQLCDAQTNPSAVVDEAMPSEPVVICRQGKREAVVVSYEVWERLSIVPSFGRLLMAAPLVAEDLPGRDNSPSRKSDV